MEAMSYSFPEMPNNVSVCSLKTDNHLRVGGFSDLHDDAEIQTLSSAGKIRDEISVTLGLRPTISVGPPGRGNEFLPPLPSVPVHGSSGNRARPNELPDLLAPPKRSRPGRGGRFQCDGCRKRKNGVEVKHSFDYQ